MRRVALKFLVGLSCVAERLNLKTLLGEIANQQFPQPRVIVDHQDLWTCLLH